MKDCTIDGPKFFREMKNLELENVNITDADETFWKVDGSETEERKAPRWHLSIHVLQEYLCRRTWRATPSMYSNTAATWRFTTQRLQPRTVSGNARM